MDSLDYILECPICNEDFSLEGEHIPRILPCTHSLCEKCIEGILRQNPEGHEILRCPECKMKHRTPKGAKSFTQNKYVLSFVRKRPEKRNVEMCGIHGREITIFCNDVDCQKAICNLCMFEEHREHNFVDFLQLKAKKNKIEAAEVESIKNNIKSLRKDLKSRKDKLLKKSQELNTNLKAQEKEIEHLKREKSIEVTQIISELYDEMAQTLRTRTEKDLESIQADVEIIEQHIVNISKHTDRNNFVDSRERLKYVLTCLELQGGDRHYTKLVFGENKANRKTIKMLCDNMLEMNLKLDFMETSETHLFASALGISSTGKRL